MKPYLVLLLILVACKKNSGEQQCFPGQSTIEVLTNRPATMKATGSRGVYVIIPQGSIDTKLRPCSIADEFKVDNLQVVVSGEVKQTVQIGPCCTNDFVISKITR